MSPLLSPLSYEPALNYSIRLRFETNANLQGRVVRILTYTY